ncbi:hypothetical protein GGX14DRAFT_563372 [Mycena pura]|uniref:Uncharacterized protein n=1 Tax=Mycena pura TaxID=153505 RepID=A0AAD6VJE0_9AGAR|nr:hypothetical protein GGX14DRAFT_563372 [Mycena pura]
MFSSRRRLLLLACLCAGARSIGLRSPPTARHGKLYARLVLPSWQSKSLIGGLLNTRQECDAGESDCGDGCCPSGLYCDSFGCCPNGETCTGSSGECPEADEISCGNGSCCRPGQSCTSDMECVDGGGGGGGGATTVKTTTTPKATTTHKTTATAKPTSSAPTSVPSAPAGSQNVVIDVSTNTDILWDGHWTSGPSSCGSGTAMSVGGTDLFSDDSMSYDFTGTAIYLSFASNNAVIDIMLDDDEVTYGDDGSPETPGNCTFGWQRTGLSAGTHNLFIDPLGSQFNLNGPLNPPWYFELQNFVSVLFHRTPELIFYYFCSVFSIVQAAAATPQPTTFAEPTTPIAEPTPTPEPSTLPDQGDQGDQGPGSGPAGIVGSAAHKNSVSWLITAVMIFLGVYLA